MKALYVALSKCQAECDEKHLCAPHPAWSSDLKNGTIKILWQPVEGVILDLYARTLTNMHTLHIYRDNDTTIGLSVDLLLRLLWFMDTHAHTHSRHTWQPLTFLRRHEYEPFPSLSAYYYPHPISCRPHCLFRNRGDSGNTHTHTYVWLNPCTHIHVHEWWNIICAHRHSPLLPGEWLTLAAKSPRGFLTFIGCQSQRTRL